MRNIDGVYINLLNYTNRNNRVVQSVIGCLIICVLLIGTLAGHYFWAYNNLTVEKERSVQLQAKNKELQDEGVDVESQRVLLADLLDRESIVEQIEAKKISHVDVLWDIENSMPVNVKMIFITFEETKITLYGLARSYDDVTELLAGLRKSPYIDGITLVTTKLDEKSKEITFTIDIGWKAGER